MPKRQKIAWLVGLLLLLFLMIAIGGVTRLTKSGLSITEWRPVTGVLPPLSEGEWERQFELYRQSPEFRHDNAHFELADYKGIFWWEYLHRLLGRVIFLYALALSFVLRRRREASWAYALALPGLIAFQGLMGWLMVRTGLHQRPSVSHYMLAAHFLLALLTVSLVYLPLARMKRPLHVRLPRADRALFAGLGVLLFTQIVYGCFTSGLKAGLYFNSFPWMGGRFLPPQAFDYEPPLRNLVENPVAVQWVHRWLGVTTGLVLAVTGVRLWRLGDAVLRGPLVHLVSVVAVQIAVGISVLLWFVPLPLAVFHQTMAVLVWLGYCNLWFRFRFTNGRSP